MTWLFLILQIPTFAQNRISLLPPRAEPTPAQKGAAPLVLPDPSTRSAQAKTKRAERNVTEVGPGNLPSYFTKRMVPENFQVILPQSQIRASYPGLFAGEIFEAQILEGVVAFSGEKAPVRALVKRGKHKGAIFLGEATLEKNSKRILIQFGKGRPQRSETSYGLKASALDESGILGIEGKLVSNEDKYFAAELLSAGAAGFTETTIDRDQNVLGNQIERSTVSNAAKRALSAALGKSTERFAEKLKTAPEYSYLEGPFSIQILVTAETE